MAEHPITPPPELQGQWQLESPFKFMCLGREDYMIDRAAQWGADQELEACCEYIKRWTADHQFRIAELRAARRPKPPSLKEQALAKLPEHPEGMASYLTLSPGSVATIRRALEALPDD